MIDVVPMLAESPEVTIERPITRTNGQVVVLKTSHLCQWLESAACYYTTLTAQALLLRKGRISWEEEGRGTLKSLRGEGVLKLWGVLTLGEHHWRRGTKCKKNSGGTDSGGTSLWEGDELQKELWGA